MTSFWTSKWLQRWWRFTRSTTPTSPRTWRGSLPLWPSWTTPSLHLWKEEFVYVENFYGCLVVDLVPWRQFRRYDWKWEDRALRAAGGYEQVVLQLSSSFLWRRMQWWDVNEHDREDEGFSAEMQKGKLMFAQAAVFNPQWEVFLFAPPCPRSCLHSRDQVQVSVKFSCNDGGDQSRWCLQWWCQRW